MYDVLPVLLIKPQFVGPKKHILARFCFATSRMIRELASKTGPKYGVYISPDDKASCPMGILAATKQAHVVMHFDY